jgi:ArsR family transcriptional regulator
LDKQKLKKAADILKAVAHPLRLEIIQLLAVEQKLSVNQICEAISGEQSLVSHHLINMKLRGILLSQKIGKSVLYTIKEPEILNIIDCINKSALF